MFLLQGCVSVDLREDIATHNEEDTQAHLKLAMTKLTTLHTLFENQTRARKEHVFKMTSFSKLKDSKKTWYSPPFYTFPGGYKMCLLVAAGGVGHGEGTHISAFLYLMAGENDEHLEWPMRGVFSIEVLNQERDQDHKKYLVRFDDGQTILQWIYLS